MYPGVTDIRAEDGVLRMQVSGPIDSRYWWNGRLETAVEWLLTIKTRRDLYKQLELLLLEKHPYDQPEILGTAVVEVSAGYLKWLNEQVTGDSAPQST